MGKRKNILIRNIYYMLSYAFQELRRNNYEEIAKEEFEQIFDLFSEILYKGISQQLKQGLYREYIERHDNLTALKGRLDINRSIRNKRQCKNLLSCEYDELSEDNNFNQILKSCVLRLINNSNVAQKRRVQLKKLLPFFSNVRTIDLGTVKWNLLSYHRNNQTYKMLMNICYFIVDGTLMTTEKGVYRMATFSEEKMSRLFERFVLEYYLYHHREFNANSDSIKWDITELEGAIIDFLPRMITDITLKKGSQILIIDTKFYTKMTQELYGKHTIHSSNMYQIYSYVKNRDITQSGKVAGLLLYAKAEGGVVPDLDVVISDNRFLVKTLDLSQEFSEIRCQLDSILDLVF